MTPGAGGHRERGDTIGTETKEGVDTVARVVQVRAGGGPVHVSGTRRWAIAEAPNGAALRPLFFFLGPLDRGVERSVEGEGEEVVGR